MRHCQNLQVRAVNHPFCTGAPLFTTTQSYFTFSGSLTGRLVGEDVTWLVL